LRIQFSSATFTGTESSKEIMVSIEMLGGTGDKSINVLINLSGVTATG